MSDNDITSEYRGGESTSADTIIEMFFARNEEAIKLCAKKYGAYCRSIAMNILSNDADSEECLDDAYLGAWNSIPPKRPENLGSYLGKLTRNLAINKYNAKHAKKRLDGEYALSLEELYDCEFYCECGEKAENETLEELGKLISDFLRREKKEARKIFVCRYFYHDSIADIAERENISESKVKSSLFRTRNKLRKYLEEEGVKI